MRALFCVRALFIYCCVLLDKNARDVYAAFSFYSYVASSTRSCVLSLHLYEHTSELPRPIYLSTTTTRRFSCAPAFFRVTAPYRVAPCNSLTLSFSDFDVNEFTLGGRSPGEVGAPTTSTVDVRLERSQPAALWQPKHHEILTRIANDIRNKHSISYLRNTDYQWLDAR